MRLSYIGLLQRSEFFSKYLIVDSKRDFKIEMETPWIEIE
ncbi:unnamed protein product [marine sediment metagenome]|uniref:Uncharacterized protein n=1 Tax=marine sediment metagenome TaxID=412755 RepID=X0U8D8_9ZZZZ